MTTENDIPPDRPTRYAEHNTYLSERLRAKQQECQNLREEALRWNKIAEEERRSWIRTHDAMNLIRQDAVEVLRTHDASHVHRELEREREKNAQLLAKRQQWRDHARRATTAKAEEAQRARDLDEVVEQLRQRLVETERSRDAALAEKERITAARDAQLDRFRAWCESWYRGRTGAIEVIAGITAELNGDIMPPVSVLELRQAVEHAKRTSLLNQATDELTAITKMLSAEGVPFRGTTGELVKDYIALMNNRVVVPETPDAEELP